jgi:hypothetical protein
MGCCRGTWQAIDMKDPTDMVDTTETIPDQDAGTTRKAWQTPRLSQMSTSETALDSGAIYDGNTGTS